MWKKHLKKKKKERKKKTEQNKPLFWKISFIMKMNT